MESDGFFLPFIFLSLSLPLIFSFLEDFILNSVYVRDCGHGYVSTGLQRRQKHLISGAMVTGVCEQLTWVLEIKLLPPPPPSINLVYRPQSFQPNHPICNCKIQTRNLNIYLCSSLTKGSANGEGEQNGEPPPTLQDQTQWESYHRDGPFPRI